MSVLKFISFFDHDGEQLGVVWNNEVAVGALQEETRITDLIENGLINDQHFIDQLKNKFSSFKKCKYSYNELLKKEKTEDAFILIPYRPYEVWGCGVTYSKVMELHEEDMSVLGKNQGLYEYVYYSDRPEIFFKALGHHCVGTHEFFGIRSDSNGTIIEAELALIYNKSGDIIAYTVANDITAWDIEKECPLFLNQSKIFKGSVVIGPAIVPACEIQDPKSFDVKALIKRRGEVVFEDHGNTINMKRDLSEFSKYLTRSNIISNGTILCTGTTVGLPNDFVVMDGDYCLISVSDIGDLRNYAKKMID